MSRFEVVRTDAEQPWHARIRASNGRIVWHTEQYKRRASAINAIEALVPVFAPLGRLKWSTGDGVRNLNGIEVHDVDERGRQ